ncbi:MFS transporter, MCP family, solute carrier family 16, member 10 [Xylariomycetidae sp. FL0641]|nr:MFS transporter, MCP family, solute carrier family 16, member 10 [Xylariomycetidae sp. FL0641]
MGDSRQSYTVATQAGASLVSSERNGSRRSLPSAWLSDTESVLDPPELERTTSSESTESTQTLIMPTRNVPKAPDGGLTAWLQVFGAFLLFFNSWGMVNAYGYFQTFYESNILKVEAHEIAWIGTVQGFLLIEVGILSGPLYDLGYLRSLIGAGTFLLCLGFLQVSAATDFLSVFLSLGVMVGIGAGCLFIPSIAIVAGYFTKKRPVATGIAASGGSVGGIVLPVLFQQLVPRVGFPWTCRAFAAIALVTLLVALAVMKPLSLPARRRNLLDLSALREPPFVLFGAALMVTFAGFYVPFFYLPSFSEDRLGASPQQAFDLLAYTNAGSVAGRIIPNLIAVYVGSMPVLLACNCLSAVVVFTWRAIHDMQGATAFAVIYGFLTGGVASLPPTAIVMLSPDLSKIGTRFGMAFGFAGVGLLVGNPIAGIILESRFEYLGLEVFSGITLMTGFFILCLAALWFKASTKLNRGSQGS